MKKYILVVLPLVAAFSLAMVSCGHDEIVEEPPVYFNSNGIPVITIKTENAAGVPADKTQSIGCEIKVVDPTGETENVDGVGKIHGRGNATWGYEKKPYKIKFDEKVSVCGFPANRDWVLLAHYCDKSLIRETFMLTLSEYIGLPYTVRHKFVELYLDGDALGVYLLTEQVEEANERVPVKKGEGYILELDNYWNKEPLWITTDHGHHFTFKYPKVLEEGGMFPDDERYNYILDYMNRFEAAIYGSDFRDPAKGYRPFVDEVTFARWYIVQEIIGNYDTNMYMTLIDHSRELELFPVWDAEWSFGLAGTGTNGWARPPQKPIIEGNIKRSQTYIYQMMHDPYFIGIVKSEWTKLKTLLPQVKIDMRNYAKSIERAQKDNFKRWPILDKYISVGLIHLDSWEAEVDYVFDFFDKRCAWFDSWLSTQKGS